jgi:hypothetical protein
MISPYASDLVLVDNSMSAMPNSQQDALANSIGFSDLNMDGSAGRDYVFPSRLERLPF